MIRRKRKSKEVSCGTEAGYEVHLRRNERPCRFCLACCDTYTDAEIAEMIRERRDSDRDRLLWSQYGIAQSTFERILSEQDNRCACCRSSEPGKTGWHVDHDHHTGLIRGILCSNCNTGIGMLGDDLAGVERAVAYLRAYIDRGGHPRDPKPPKERATRPRVSKRMQECFDLFAQGVPPNKVVVLKKMTPASMNEVYEAWRSRDGSLTRRSEHFFRIVKEEPHRCVCACGYTKHFHRRDIHSMVEAIDGLNAHILEEQSKELERHLQLERELRAKPAG